MSYESRLELTQSNEGELNLSRPAAKSRLSLSIDTNLDLNQRQAIARALDLMGCALADHDHQWTSEECEAYESAHRELGRMHSSAD